MLFDLRGKRKRFIQVIYAMLAVLMGGGLIAFGIGGEVSGGLLDAFTSGQGAQSGDLVDEAEELEERSAEAPRNPELLERLIRARYTAGNSLYEFDDTGQQSLTSEAEEQFEQAADAWDRYVRAVPQRRIDPSVAQLAANAFFAMAEGATDGNEARSNAAAAAEAQARYAAGRPSVGSLSSLAIYHYFGNDFESGDEAARRAEAEAGGPAAKRDVARQMQQYRRQAREFQDELDAYIEATEAGGEDQQGAPQIQDPAGGFGGGFGGAGGGLGTAP